MCSHSSSLFTKVILSTTIWFLLTARVGSTGRIESKEKLKVKDPPVAMKYSFVKPRLLSPPDRGDSYSDVIGNSNDILKKKYNDLPSTSSNTRANNSSLESALNEKRVNKLLLRDISMVGGRKSVPIISDAEAITLFMKWMRRTMLHNDSSILDKEVILSKSFYI